MLDDEVDADLIEGILRAGDLAFQLRQVHTREEFEQALENQTPDLILSDHGRQEFDGVAALSIARKKCPNVPFIFIAASDEDPLALEALERGADGFLSRDHLLHWLPKVKRSLRFAEREAQHLRIEQSLRDDQQRHQDARAELEERVARKSRELQDAAKELEAFSYSVSHDLRAPLRHINAFIYLLEKSLNSNLSDESRRQLRLITDAAEHLGELVDDLLSLSRIGRQTLRKVPVPLGSLVNEARYHLSEEIRGRNIEWVIGSLPVVQADPVALRQVLVNLLSNALKYSAPRDRARIEVACQNRGAETVFFVRDNGVGFDMRQSSRLFGVFQRLHDEKDFEGTGIGLAIVRRVIQRHGGCAWAEGVVDRGATFYFSLPNDPPEASLQLSRAGKDLSALANHRP
jgi:signal transduction histidine kinase